MIVSPIQNSIGYKFCYLIFNTPLRISANNPLRGKVLKKKLLLCFLRIMKIDEPKELVWMPLLSSKVTKQVNKELSFILLIHIYYCYIWLVFTKNQRVRHRWFLLNIWSKRGINTCLTYPNEANMGFSNRFLLKK